MSPASIILLVFAYFVLLMVDSFTGKTLDNDTFLTDNKSSSWYVATFGMIGASLFGVTFISVPSWIEASQFSYT